MGNSQPLEMEDKFLDIERSKYSSEILYTTYGRFRFTLEFTNSKFHDLY